MRNSKSVPAGSQDGPNHPLRSALPGAVQRSQRWQILLHNVSALHPAGIRLGVGTDAGVTGTHHVPGRRRASCNCPAARRVSPMQAITAATFDSARALRVDHETRVDRRRQGGRPRARLGAPHQNVNDIERIARVFLGGREIDREALARRIGSKEPSPLEAIKVAEQVDDFETAASGQHGRLRRRFAAQRPGTLWINSSDTGHDHRPLMMARTLRRDDLTRSLFSRACPRPTAPLSGSAFLLLPAPRSLPMRQPFGGIRFDARPTVALPAHRPDPLGAKLRLFSSPVQGWRQLGNHPD